MDSQRRDWKKHLANAGHQAAMSGGSTSVIAERCTGNLSAYGNKKFQGFDEAVARASADAFDQHAPEECLDLFEQVDSNSRRISEHSSLGLINRIEHRFWVTWMRLQLDSGEVPDFLSADESKVRAVRLKRQADLCLTALDGLYTLLKVEIQQCLQLQRERRLLKKELLQVSRQLVESQLREKQARYLALHDELTSLPNRSFFRQRLSAAFSGDAQCTSKVSVIYLDLDGFKGLNDEHGHQAGDELLKLVAARLLRSVRAEDMLSRLGGDEFACLVFGLSARQLLTMAKELHAIVSAPCQIGKTLFVVRPSIGIAMAPLHGVDADSLLESADAAMYVAKKRKSGYTFAREGSYIEATGVATLDGRPETQEYAGQTLIGVRGIPTEAATLRAGCVDTVEDCEWVGQSSPHEHFDAIRAIGNVESWNEYLPSKCVDSMINAGWPWTV